MADGQEAMTRVQAQEHLATFDMEQLSEQTSKRLKVLEHVMLRSLMAQGMPPDHPMGRVMTDNAALEAQLGGLMLLLIRKNLVTEQEAAASVLEGIMAHTVMLQQAEAARSRIIRPGAVAP